MKFDLELQKEAAKLEWQQRWCNSCYLNVYEKFCCKNSRCCRCCLLWFCTLASYALSTKKKSKKKNLNNILNSVKILYIMITIIILYKDLKMSNNHLLNKNINQKIVANIFSSLVNSEKWNMLLEMFRLKILDINAKRLQWKNAFYIGQF